MLAAIRRLECETTDTLSIAVATKMILESEWKDPNLEERFIGESAQ